MRKLLSTSALCVILALILIPTAAVQNRTVDQNSLKNAGKDRPEDWLTHGLNYEEQRYSLLKQIDATNVGRLRLAWTFEIGTGGGNQAATPLVHNGILYSITNWSITFAVDTRTGKEVWRYDPKVNRATILPKICCGNVSRGLALYQEKVYVPVIDGRLVALSVATGKELWSVQTTPLDEAYTITGAPRVVTNNVIIGNAGADAPVRGYISAYDAISGKLKWRFYTVPGDPKKGFENRAMEVAAKTWSGQWYQYGGGGNVWDAMSFDPDSNLIYFGTGNGGPWPSELRQSKGLDNLYVASIIAVNADTGEYRWHYQATPEDSWDFDSVQQLTIADIRIGSELRRVIMQANKNGFFYVLDRISGKVISAEPFAQVNWASKIDLQSGRPMVNPGARYGREQIVTIMPSGGSGAHNTSPMAFNRITNLMYIPASAMTSQEFRVQEDFTYLPNRLNTNGSAGNRPDRGQTRRPPSAAPLPVVGPREAGEWLVAIDPSTQEEKWRAQAGTGKGGGVLTTAANLVFQSTSNGYLRAYRADTGEKLLDITMGLTDGAFIVDGQPPRQVSQGNLGVGPPITFMVDGKQYVAVAGGIGTVESPGVPAAILEELLGVAGVAGRRGRGGPPPFQGPPPRLSAYALGDDSKQASSGR